MSARRFTLWEYFRRLLRESPSVIKAAETNAAEYGGQADPDYPQKSILNDIARESLPPQDLELLTKRRPLVQRISRRAFIAGGYAALGVGSVVGGEYVMRIAGERILEVLPGTAAVNSITPDFIRSLSGARSSEEALQDLALPYRVEEPQKLLTTIIHRFDMGGFATDDELAFLERIRDKTHSPEIRYFAAHHLSGERLRIGEGQRARQEIEGIQPSDIPDDRRLDHVVQTTAIGFNTLHRATFREPSNYWGWSRQISDLAALLNIRDGDVPEFRNRTSELRQGLREHGAVFVHGWFFYMMNLAGLTPTREERREIWDEILVLLRLAADPVLTESRNLTRAASNELLPLAAHAHNVADWEYRDKFLSIAFGGADFWPDSGSYVKNFSWRVAKRDHMASLTVLFLEALRAAGEAPPWAGRMEYGLDLIRQDVSTLANAAVKKGVDNVRKRQGERMNNQDTFQTHAEPAEVFGLYLV